MTRPANPVELLESLGHQNPTPEYTPVGERVGMTRWGADHWSTLGYLETRIVDHRGMINHDHMRCHGDRHPFMLVAKRRSGLLGGGDGRAYPTRLRNGETAERHDDYDCIDDMIAAGLVGVVMPPAPDATLVTGLVESELMTRATYYLTEAGQAVAGELRAFKGAGGTWRRFVPPALPPVVAP